MSALGPDTSDNRTPCGMPRIALISFWAMHVLPQVAGYLKR